ncbi:MAG TPA: ATP-binding protein [Solirubrobacterales bacterium]|jgi:serine/threonine-protein kinase RsbW|nr:ATP-binding protein [Solirubrobacterales bacterium]
MTTASEGGLRRSFAAEPTSVGVARRMVAEFAAGLGMGEPRLADLKTTVGEACGNVVRHAYPSAAGDFEVDARAAEGRLTVTVRDSGVGLRPSLPEIGEARPRIGLGLISVLADGYLITGRTGGGTEVRITLGL